MENRGDYMDIIFETEHLIIRKFKKEDAEQLYLNHREEKMVPKRKLYRHK